MQRSGGNPLQSTLSCHCGTDEVWGHRISGVPRRRGVEHFRYAGVEMQLLLKDFFSSASASWLPLVTQACHLYHAVLRDHADCTRVQHCPC